MNKTGLAFLSALGLAASLVAAPAPTWPPLADISLKLKAELPSLPEPATSIQDAEAYVRSLGPWVLPPDTDSLSTVASPLSKTNRYSGGAAYLRIQSVSSTLPANLAAAVAALRQAGPVTGWVLDLRFAGGSEHRAAIESASLWCAKEVGEFHLGGETFRPLRHEQAPSAPVLILINRQTRQAAETFATAVRLLANRALTLGTNSAGQARTYRPFPVSDTVSLRLAGEALRLPDGSEFSTNGLMPDVLVSTSEDDERAYAQDEYRRISQGRPFVSARPSRLNEAELVRRRRSPRSGSMIANPHLRSEDRSRPDSESQAIQPLDAEGALIQDAVQDPTLALALDLISGVAAEALPAEAASKGPSEGESR